MKLIEFFEENGFLDISDHEKVSYQKQFIINTKLTTLTFSSKTVLGSMPIVYFKQDSVFYIFSCIQNSSSRLFNNKVYMETNAGIDELIEIINKMCNEIDGIVKLSNFFVVKNQSFIPVGNSFILNSKLPMLKVYNSSVTFYERTSGGDQEFMKIINKEPEALYLLHNYAMSGLQ